MAAQTKLQSQLKSTAFLAAQTLRATNFLAQSVFGSILLGRRPSPEQARELAPTPFILKRLWELLRIDAQNISDGVYAAPKDWIESPLEFTKTSIRATLDLFSVKEREKTRSIKEVPLSENLSKLPKYYLQNFHFQTGGWLSEHSANLYDHQVEVVFAGGAGAMRRQALPPIKKHIAESSLIEQDLKFMDLASGTGSFASELKLNFPKAHLTVNDMSPFYLKKARAKLAHTIGTDFIEANAESLPFKDSHFDVISCIYLFHELPKLVRSKVMQEAHRLLKPGGIFVLVDSIQLDDIPEMNGSLKFFPLHYHEPYYLDYIAQPIGEYAPSTHWTTYDQRIAFFSKITVLKKL